MIEFQVEAFLEFVGESFQRRIIPIYVCVADRAHRHVRRRELREVTAGAIFVTGKDGPRGIIIAMMTARTANRRVALAGVEEF
jgi:hypothetical protein